MAYRIQTETLPKVQELDPTLYIIESPDGQSRAAIWPALGFNCLQWQVSREGRTMELLYLNPQQWEDLRPTRSGIPVLFPFPNRIRDGRFSWEGKTYQLPLNDSSKKNAIHGFACRHPWRVVDQGAEAESGWLTGEFWASKDAPESLALWPADHRIRLTYRLQGRRLRLEALVENPDTVSLPFGLGFHPYFRVPLVPGGRAEDVWVEAATGDLWELVESLPTGSRRPEPKHQLTQPRRYRELDLDNLYTVLEIPAKGRENLSWCGTLRQAPEEVVLQVFASPNFRELVAFTPPHREAMCLEPYTCTTDAINLQPRGVEAGLMVLPPDGRWSGVVEMECTWTGQ
ncbi:MAG: aldose 1-epimerase [Planctomycetes bacterium]|nr:aldose 1-epimerase [Planctomycetota bacterium]